MLQKPFYPMTRRKALSAIGAFTTAPLVKAQTDAYPNRPIKLILGFPPGGPNDIVARVLGIKLGDILGKTIVIDNRPGAIGTIATKAVVNSPADGYTLLYTSTTFVLAAALRSSLPFDPIKDLSPVVATVAAPMVLMVHPALPCRTVDDFIAYVKANPGKLSFASGGNGSITHVAPVQLLHHSGLDAIHIPYKGSSPAMIDLAGGQVQFAMDASNSAMPFIRDGRLRAIAVTSRNRLSALPQIPTIAESWIPNYEAIAWQGVMAPSKTPPIIVNRLNSAIIQALMQDGVREKLQELGIDVIGGSPQSFAALVNSEIERWSKVGKQANIVMD